ncbi:PucR family transcriptional regulator ligand-binding domain-containing protein [Gordonia sp. FQ]|uniref:helix-turn-helix domain-containing protein n=1 Tax=Gordonia sp. FQ TaxID=3446634 RepID=UPI003F82D25B
MAVSLQWLLGRRELDLRLLTPGITGPEIDIAVTSELGDPSPWLSGNELVLTTGLGSAGRDQDEYVRRLAASGAAALGMGTGLTFDRVPPALVDAAHRHGIPLIEVPLPTPFVAVARAVADRIGELSARATQSAARAQPRMTRAAVTGGAPAVLRELATACRGTVVLTDSAGALTHTRPAQVAPEIAAMVTREVRELRAGTASVAHTPAASVVVQPVASPGRTHGYLVVVTERPPLPADQVLIGHAASLLALQFEPPREAAEAGWALNGAAVGLLLTGEADLSAARRLVATVTDETGHVRAMVLSAPPDKARALARTLERGLVAAGLPVFVWTSAPELGEVVVLLRGGHSAASALLDGVAAPSRRRVRAGLSRPYPAGQLTDAVDEARYAARGGRPGGRVHDASARPPLLADAAVRTALEKVAAQAVVPLAAYDAEHGTVLVDSLRTYLECHGQWEAAGAALGVHRHTLRARIVRAQEVAAVDLSSATTRAELLLALLAVGEGGTAAAG